MVGVHVINSCRLSILFVCIEPQLTEHSSYRSHDVDNWTIIELQGTLEAKEEVSLEGKAIGDLHFDGKVGES